MISTTNDIKVFAIPYFHFLGRFVVALLLFILISVTSQASVLYLKPGQSKTIKVDNFIGTVFVSDSNKADYKVIGDNRVAIYAKKMGYADFIIYGQDDQVLANYELEIDAIIPDLHYRVKRDFPNSDVRISRQLGGERGEKAIYILSGSVSDGTVRDQIYTLVGSIVGTTGEKKTIDYTSSESDDIHFLRRYIYENVIDRMQVIDERQVNVKLTLVEVSQEFKESMGIEWQSLTLDSIVNKGTDISSVGTFNLLGLKGGFDIDNIATIIRAVANDSLAKVLAEPNLTVLSGEVASFLVGGEIPIITNGGTDSSSTVTYKEYGIKLSVGAKVNNEHIRLFIDNEFSSVSGAYAFNDYQVPTLTSRRTSSTIELKDGDSFIISGLVSEQDAEGLTKIPFISDIPILGALTRSVSTSRSRKELVVFATVKLVSPKNSFNNVSIPSFERTDYRNIFFNINNNHDKQYSKSFPISSESERFINDIGFIE